LEDGVVEGFPFGLEDGAIEGFPFGFNVGIVEGCRNGRIEGRLVGFLVGGLCFVGGRLGGGRYLIVSNS
jgi:hypothetical protein